jgi:hypothetical protein
MEMGVEGTINGTGLNCFCKQEAEGNKVRVETYRKNPKRCQKFGKKKYKLLLILLVHTCRSQPCSKNKAL